MSSAKVKRTSTGSTVQREYWEQGFNKKVSEGVLAAGNRQDPAAQTSVQAVQPGDILRIRPSAQSWIAFSEDATALAAATINAAYADSPVLELNDTAKEYLIAAPPLSERGAKMYYRMSVAPSRIEKIPG